MTLPTLHLALRQFAEDYLQHPLSEEETRQLTEFQQQLGDSGEIEQTLRNLTSSSPEKLRQSPPPPHLPSGEIGEEGVADNMTTLLTMLKVFAPRA